MPWIGLRDGNSRVIPEQVKNGDRVYCPECRSQMFPRGPSSDGRARHFVHISSVFSDCPGGGGGESDIHLKWKSMVLSALKQRYPENARCGPEVRFDVSDTYSPKDERWADTLVEFEEEDDLLGKGIVVEVQHENKSKDRLSVTYDYLSKSYSVFWAEEEHFESDRFDVHWMLDALETSEDYEIAAATARFSAQQLSVLVEDQTVQDTLFVTEEEEDRTQILDADGHLTPNIPTESHSFYEVYEQRKPTGILECKDCGLKVYSRSRPPVFFNLGIDPNAHLRSILNSKLENECIGAWYAIRDGFECTACGRTFDR